MPLLRLTQHTPKPKPVIYCLCYHVRLNPCPCPPFLCLFDSKLSTYLPYKVLPGPAAKWDRAKGLLTVTLTIVRDECD